VKHIKDYNNLEKVHFVGLYCIIMAMHSAKHLKKILKFSRSLISGPVSFNFNKSIYSVFPDALKTAIIKPLHNKSETSSTTLQTNLLAERVVYSTVMRRVMTFPSTDRIYDGGHIRL